MSVNWHDILLTWCRNLPNQPLDLQEAFVRATHANRMALDPSYAEDVLRQYWLSTAALGLEEPLPLPPSITAGSLQTSRDISSGTPLEDGPDIRHPLSGASWHFPTDPLVSGVTQQCSEAIAALLQHCQNDRSRFLALWRFLPSRLGAIAPALNLLPANIYTPDHSLWNQLDLQAALTAAFSDSHRGALLSFTLGPVQSFITQARSIRDLWAGSYLLSWLTFQAMQPVLDACGPTALIFPGLRGNPLYDLHLKTTYQHAPFTTLNPDKPIPQPDVLLTGSLPNTFLALVPHSTADELAAQAEHRCRTTWHDISEAVLCTLEQSWDKRTVWAQGWEEQVNHFWEIRTVTLPLQPSSGTSLAAYFKTYLKRWPPSKAVDTLIQVSGTGDQRGPQTPAGTWALHTRLAGRVLVTTKQIRNIPQHAPADDPRSKCTLMGSYEQMGPRGSLQEQNRFWGNIQRQFSGTHLRSQERLCAIALIKRFCWAAYFTKRLVRRPTDLRFSDTATIAASEWLQKAAIEPDKIRAQHHDWSGQWLFQEPRSWKRLDQKLAALDLDPPPLAVQTLLLDARSKAEAEDREAPLSYYAAVVMDGDHMGQWVSGDRAPCLKQVYHPRSVEAFEAMATPESSQVHEALAQKRPLSPALHMALTAALGNFAQAFVPDIVETQHHGELVYAGGDDVLALLPTRHALDCLYALQQAYSGTGGTLGTLQVPQGWAIDTRHNQILTLLGKTATVSAGLAVAHYKTDLREVLQAARTAEHAAKHAGRNALGLAVLRRSGEHTYVVCPWTFVPSLNNLVKAFVAGASDRWAYHLHTDLETLSSLPPEAVAKEISRVVDRSEPTSRRILATCMSNGQTPDLAQAGAQAAACYHRLRQQLSARAQDTVAREADIQQRACADFLNLVQAAAFLARGRDNE